MDLVERLNRLVILDEVGSDNPLGREAANELTRLRNEVEGLRKGTGASVARADMTPDGASDGLRVLEKSAGQIAYEWSTDNDPLIHSNRFPAWSELTDEQRAEWQRKSEGGAA